MGRSISQKQRSKSQKLVIHTLVHAPLWKDVLYNIFHSLRHPMTPLSEFRGLEHTGIVTSSNAAYTMVKQGRGVGMEKGNESAEYEVVSAPDGSHPQSQASLAEENGYDVPCPPEHPRLARKVPAMNVPPIPQGSDEKGLDEAIYEPVPGDQ